MTGRDLATERDPGRNPQFHRRWTDDPLALPDLQYLAREVAPQAVEGVARRAIGRWLDKASRAHGAPAAEAFREADAIRERLGLDWGELIDATGAA